MNKKKFLFLLLPPAAVLAYACGDPSHLFLGRQYEETRECLGATASIDVVTGDAPGECSSVCLTQPADDGGAWRVVWVASMCPPYPWNFDAAGTDPACAPALAAAARHDRCYDDGGSSAPLVDAGDDAGDAASEDAGEDAGEDAATDAATEAGHAHVDASDN